MHIIRTISWVVLTAFVMMFVSINFGEPQRVKLWPSEDPVGFDWPVGVIALVFLLLGAVPTWLYHRGVKWSLNRRIRSLENSVKSNALSNRHKPTSTDTSQDTTAANPASVDKPVGSSVKPGDTLTPTEGDGE